MRKYELKSLAVVSTALAMWCTHANATEVTVVSSRGNVTISQGDHLVAVGAMTHLTLPAQIRTGADGMIDLKDSDSLVHIGPNSTIALPDSGPSGSLVDHYLQSAGSALYNIQSRHGRPMSVETPYLVSVVKGTVFTIAVEGDSTKVTLMEGSLDVSAPGLSQHVLLKPNESIRHKAGDQSLVVVPAQPVSGTIKNSTADDLVPATDQVHATQVAMVTRDLSEIGATVATQRMLITTPPATPPVSPPAGGTTSSGNSGGGSSTATLGGGTSSSGSATSGSTASTSSSLTGSGSAGTTGSTSTSSSGSTGSASGTTSTSSSSTAGGSSTSGSTTSGSTAGTGATSGSGSASTGSTSGSTSTGSTSSSSSGSTATTGSASGSTSTGSSGASGTSDTSGSSSSGSTSTTTVGCNGKTNGTGLGNCVGHGKH